MTSVPATPTTINTVEITNKYAECSTSSIHQMSCAELLFVAVLSIQLGTSFSLHCLLRNPADNDVCNLCQLPDPLHHP